jgi:hypothetical protein
MEPEHFRFGGGSAGTVLHPLVALVMILVIILILRLPRRRILAPLLLAIFLIPSGQVVLLAGVHLNVYRIILLAGLVRWMVSRHTSALAGGFTSIDRLVTLWALSLFFIFSLQYASTQALIKSLGDLFDVLSGYFVLRSLVKDREDVRQVFRVFAFIAIILGVCMLNEQRTGRNVFGQLGGILAAPEVRNGKIRSQGTFQHSITAGSFGATLVPLLVWLWSDIRSRKIALLGLLGASAMTITGHSSTTLGCYGAGIFGLCLWPLRRQMRLIRWGLAAILIGLHLAMNGPVWSLLEHIDLTGSSESYHRYQLVDTFIRHFGDWWLLGTKDNASWGWEMADTSNQYVTYGVSGGLLTFALFIAIISKSLGNIGTARKCVAGNRTEEWFLWCLGSSMFAHVVVYFGIDYFDQMEFAWLAFVGIISLSVFGANQLRTPQVKKRTASSYMAHPCDESEKIAVQVSVGRSSI